MLTVRVCPAQMVTVLAGLLERKLPWGRERISQVPGRTVRRWRSCTPPRPGRRRRRTARPPSRPGMSPAGRVRRLIVRWDELTEAFLGDQPEARARAGRAWQGMGNEHADQLPRSSRGGGVRGGTEGGAVRGPPVGAGFGGGWVARLFNAGLGAGSK